MLFNTCYGESSSYKIFINEKELISSTQPINVKGRIMVPIRNILEFIDADFKWIPDKKMITITKDHNSIDLRINTPFCSVNGKSLNMDVPALIKHGRTYVPIRFLAESLEMDVNWDESINAVLISTDIPGYIVPDASPSPSEESEEYEPTATPTATPAPVATPSLESIGTQIPYQASTPAPTPQPQTPSNDVVVNIKAFINGEELDYKFIGAQLVEQQGVLYGNQLFAMVALRVYCEYDSTTDKYQLRNYSDEDEESYTALNTKPIDDNWVPVLEVCKELNLQYEYKDHVLSIIDPDLQ
jgi:hypothetical protein